ncbi:MAG: hypothetical protein HKN14_04750 [Marinicaulis sp.]|nr:hypothetical protein [Marinicaulis sp.]NNE40211.1 hypothetical protein [Marinicaulis sp.]NNL88825.1 hypothetical protein [Marinicaulis sp.]
MFCYRPKEIRKFLATVFSLTAFSIQSPIHAQSLKELRSQDAEEAQLNQEISYTSTICGRPISANIDWKSAADWPDDVSLAAACDSALSALEAACRTDQTLVVTKFICAGDASGALLSGSTLRYGAAPGANGFSITKSYLERLR